MFKSNHEPLSEAQPIALVQPQENLSLKSQEAKSFGPKCPVLVEDEKPSEASVLADLQECLRQARLEARREAIQRKLAQEKTKKYASS